MGFQIEADSLSSRQYWRHFGRLIQSVNYGAALACTGWLSFWFDHIPNHVFHTHALTIILFLAALGCGISAGLIMVRTGNRLGTRRDRVFHVALLVYILLGAVSGLTAFAYFPPH